MCQIIICTTIDCLRSYDVFARFRQCLECITQCCCSGCNCQCCNSAFQRCDSLFKNILCRISKSSVNVSCITKSKSVCCMLWIMEYVRCCSVDWNCSCICYRICFLLSDVKLSCFKSPVFRISWYLPFFFPPYVYYFSSFFVNVSFVIVFDVFLCCCFVFVDECIVTYWGLSV